MKVYKLSEEVCGSVELFSGSLIVIFEVCKLSEEFCVMVFHLCGSV